MVELTSPATVHGWSGMIISDGIHRLQSAGDSPTHPRLPWEVLYSIAAPASRDPRRQRDVDEPHERVDVKRLHTPGDSKQQRSVCLVVLWQDVGPLVEHPELMRLVNKFIASTGLVSDDAIAEPARAPKARVAASILKSTASGGCG